MPRTIIDLGLEQGIGVDMDDMSGEGDLVAINPRGREYDNSGGKWYRTIYERVNAEPDEKMVEALARAVFGARWPSHMVNVRIVISAYRNCVLRGTP